jgi:hypothetical protein
MTRKLHRIVSEREGCGNTLQINALSSAPAATSDGPPTVNESDEAAVSVCLDKAGLARFLNLSVRSLDRANAMGMLPHPDLVCGRSPRWSPDTIARWLKTRPRLPGRKGDSA